VTKAELEKKVRQLEGRIRELEGTGALFVSVVQDKSGSMRGQEKGVIDGFNEYVESLRDDEDDTEVRFTLTQFDHEFEVLYEDAHLDSVRALNSTTYKPRGSTALLDAVGMTIESLDKAMQAGDRALVIVMTDGYENSSRKFNYRQVSEMIAKREKKNFTFVYIGADQDAWSAGTSLGFQGGSTLSHENSYHGRVGTMRSLGQATNTYKSAGVAQSASFVQDFMSVEDEEGK
jgi:uncharacterized protein YegL